MTNLIKQYEELHNKVKERAVHINDMLGELVLPKHLESFRTPYCGVMAEDLNMKLDHHSVVLTYDTPWEDCREFWIVNKEWIDMRDEGIISSHMREAEYFHSEEKQDALERLKREAEMFNMMLVPKENGE